MREKYQIRFSGAGGQGVILASVILAKAALSESLFTAQSQSYGPEARGGVCKADVIISKNEIDYPYVENADCVLALTQDSFDRYGLCCKGIVLADSSIDTDAYKESGTVVCAPILRTAAEEVGKAGSANIVAAGAVNALLDIVKAKSLEAAVLKNVPKGTEELNIRALREGVNLIGNGCAGDGN